MEASPPCLPPVSGVLVMTNPQVVRPVALRAVQRDGSLTPYEGSIVDELSSSSSNVNSPAMLSPQSYHSSLGRAAFHRCAPQSTSKLSDHVLDSGHSSALLPDEGLRAITELEAQLREKETEIAYLRQTLEDNERAIINVYKEKEENLRKHYEQLLQAQGTFPKDRRCDYYHEELWGIVDDNDPKHLQESLYQCQQELCNVLQAFHKERVCWLKEKAKVLQYQRHLELGYWQICSHNRQLLRTISRVSMLPLDACYHLESRCSALHASNPELQTFGRARTTQRQFVSSNMSM